VNAKCVAMFELVRRATVPIGRAADREHLGTGFFVAPGSLLTAAHVVGEYANDPAGVEVFWDGEPKPCTSIVLLADPPAGWLDNGAPYPWPDVAILEVAHEGHPCVRLSTERPPEAVPRPWLYAWGYARDYDPDAVGGTSVRVEYVGPIEQSSPPPAPGQDTPTLLSLMWARVIPGMSGAPLLDERTLEVCAIMKRTRTELAVEGGFATAIADVRGLAANNAAVKDLIAAHDAYHDEHDVDAEADATARWGRLPNDVAALVERHDLVAALAQGLADFEYPVDLDGVDDPDRAQCVARALFATDVKTVGLVLKQLVEQRVLDSPDALSLFDTVACCLPVSKEWRSEDPDRPVHWWVAPEAADQLAHEMRAQERRVAHVATDKRGTVQMLARRASRTKRLELHDADALGDVTPEGASFLECVDAVIRDITHAEKGWQRNPVERELTKDFIEDLGKLIPLPSIRLQPADLAALRDEFGDLPYVLYGREVFDALGTSKAIVSIRPEFDAGQEGVALFFRRALEPLEKAS
jgi:Trypsin-like peptidase domain